LIAVIARVTTGKGLSPPPARSPDEWINLPATSFDGAPVEKFMKANGIHPHLEIEELSVTFDLDLWPFMNVVCDTLSCDTI